LADFELFCYEYLSPEGFFSFLFFFVLFCLVCFIELASVGPQSGGLFLASRSSFLKKHRKKEKRSFFRLFAIVAEDIAARFAIPGSTVFYLLVLELTLAMCHSG
jgi:amino acid transporter